MCSLTGRQGLALWKAKRSGILDTGPFRHHLGFKRVICSKLSKSEVFRALYIIYSYCFLIVSSFTIRWKPGLRHFFSWPEKGKAFMMQQQVDRSRGRSRGLDCRTIRLTFGRSIRGDMNVEYVRWISEREERHDRKSFASFHPEMLYNWLPVHVLDHCTWGWAEHVG